jgi:hypothetical protein
VSEEARIFKSPRGNWMYQENTSRNSFVGSKIELVFGCECEVDDGIVCYTGVKVVVSKGYKF